MAKMVKCKSCGQEIAKSAKTCPHCGAKQKKHIVLGVVLVLIGIILLAAAFGGGGEDPHNVDGDPADTHGNNSQPTNEGENSPGEPIPETIKIPAEDLYAAYIENAVNADNLYKNKTLEVTGTITNIGQDAITKKPCISLDSGDSLSVFPVQCFFSASSDAIAALRDGDVVTITGKCTGYNIAYVQLTGCKLN